MTPRSSRTRRRIAGILLAALIAIGATVLLMPPVEIDEVSSRRSQAVDFDPRTAPPPWAHRCPISITAYEDGSASLYCGRRKQSFARIDAESGRIRMRAPWLAGRTRP
jgi:hypothetical protein